MDIQVADRRGQVAEPLELRRVPAAQAVREHVAEQLDRGAGAAGGDPQVVQELGVDVTQHAIDVALHGVEQPEQQGRDRDRGRLLRGDLRGDAVAVVRRVAAEGVQGVEERAAPGRGDPGSVGHELRGPGGRAGIAADFGDGQPRGQDDGLAGPDDGRAVHDQPGDGLAVGVEQPGDADGAGRGGHRQQGSRAGQLGDPVPDRPGGQVGGQPGPAGAQAVGGLLGLGHLVLAEQQAAAAALALVVQDQAGPVQPPVEGIQPGVLAGAAARRGAVGGDPESLTEHVEDGGYPSGLAAAPDLSVKLESPQVRRHKIRFSFRRRLP